MKKLPVFKKILENFKTVFYRIVQIVDPLALFTFILYLINGHNLFFYGFLGASARTLFSIFTIVYYNNSLFENAKNFDKYRLRKEKKINLIEKILSK